MKAFAFATVLVLSPLAAHSQAFVRQDSEWCPDLAPMSSYLSIGFELKAVSERLYASADSNNKASMPNGVRSETVFFLQKGKDMERCSEQIKWDFSADASCSRLVQRFDSSKGSPCQ